MNKKTIIKTILITIIYAFYITISLIKPESDLKYSWHFAIWAPITAYVVFWEGRRFLYSYKNLFLKKQYNSETIVAVSVHIMFLYSLVISLLHVRSDMFSYPQLWAGAALLVIVSNMGKEIGNSAKKESDEKYDRISKVKGKKVLVQRKDEIEIRFLDEVRVGDIIIIKKNEVVPLDGILMQSGTFNYSNVTGKSGIMYLKKRDKITSGAYNMANDVKLKVLNNFEGSTINMIISSLDEVSKTRPELQKAAKKTLKIFIPFVFVFYLIVFVAWLTISLTTSYDLPWKTLTWSIAISGSLAGLVLSLSGIVGYSSPLIYKMSSVIAHENSIIIRNPKAIEDLAKAKIIVFGKTGILTNIDVSVDEMIGDEKLIGIAKGLERNSTHPISRAIMKMQGATADVTDVKHFDSGVRGTWKGKRVEIRKSSNDSRRISVSLFVDGKEKLIIKLLNEIKVFAKEMIQDIKKEKISVAMITGDNAQHSNDIARELGIDTVYAGIGLKEKTEVMMMLKEKYGKTVYIGRIEDANKFSKEVDTTLSFVNGENITQSYSDINLLDPSPKTISRAVKLSRINQRRIKTSIISSTILGLSSIPVSALLFIQPWMAVVVVAGTNLFILLNTAIFKRKARKKLK